MPVSAKKIIIYALIDPRDGAIRYVGKTDKPERRLAKHKHSTNAPLRRWFAEVLATGVTPVMKTLREVSEAEWKAAEIEEIARHHAICRLFNVQAGGSNRWARLPVTARGSSRARRETANIAKRPKSGKRVPRKL